MTDSGNPGNPQSEKSENPGGSQIPKLLKKFQVWLQSGPPHSFSQGMQTQQSIRRGSLRGPPREETWASSKT